MTWIDDFYLMYLLLHKDVWNSLLIVYREELNSMYFYIYNLCISIYSDRYRYCTYCIFIPICGKERDSEQKRYFILSITVLLPSSVFSFIIQNCSTWSAELWTTMCVWKIEIWASVHQNLPQLPCRVHTYLFLFEVVAFVLLCLLPAEDLRDLTLT